MLDQPPHILVRPSAEDDVAAMLAIYAYHVQHGLGDYHPMPIQPEDIKRRRKTMLKRSYPHLVAENCGKVVGYAYAVPFLKRPAYRYSVKHSIYVDKDHLNVGVGSKLLPALIDACAAAGFRQMICYIDGSNAPSLRLHQSCGFERAGVLRSVSYKFEHWCDTVLMQRVLGPGDSSRPSERGNGFDAGAPDEFRI